MGGYLMEVNGDGGLVRGNKRGWMIMLVIVWVRMIVLGMYDVFGVGCREWGCWKKRIGSKKEVMKEVGEVLMEFLGKRRGGR